ncbi:hypothetical protein D5086_001390 [Populus alba]|uniref:Uncharacterized protein n=1 Tax=Populus alba TaxID=43335 RepID=A0ACC4CYS0_POPAL
MLPKLSPDQFLKLKQLTVLALSATNKILSYNELLEELEVCNVHELEDFLNNECVFAAGLSWVSMDFGSHTGYLLVSIGLDKIMEIKLSFETLCCCWNLLDNLSNWCSVQCITCDFVLCFEFSKICYVFAIISPKHEFFLNAPLALFQSPYNSLCLLLLVKLVCPCDNHCLQLSESKQGLCFWKNVDGFGYLGGLMEQEEDLIRSKSSNQFDP